MDVKDGLIKIIDNTDELLHEALKNGDTLATPQESQMLVYMTGVSINSKPRKDGRYQGYILNAEDSGKKYFYGRTREEVAVKIKIYLQEVKTPKRKTKEKNTPLFGEYVDNWIKLYKEPNLKPKSLKSLKDTLRYALDKFNDTKLGNIKTDDIQQFLMEIKALRVRELVLLYLNQIFEKARISGIIKANPCEAVEMKKHKSAKKTGLLLSEQNSFIKAISGTEHELLCLLLLSTGLRIGEALALNKNDIDFENETINVNKNVVYINNKRIMQDTPKTDAGNRIIPCPKEICLRLKEIESDPLFPQSYNSVNKFFQRIAKELGIKVSAHILRHTYSDRLEEAGVPPKVKQYLMGHAKLDTTQNIYTDAQPEYINRSADLVKNSVLTLK